MYIVKVRIAREAMHAMDLVGSHDGSEHGSTLQRLWVEDGVFWLGRAWRWDGSNREDADGMEEEEVGGLELGINLGEERLPESYSIWGRRGSRSAGRFG